MGTGTDAFLRVRVIAGGQDAIFLVTKMCEMYSRYAEPKGWTTTLLSERVYSEGAESIALIGGDRAFNKLQHEAGIHRFQWVPPAGGQGRVLTFRIMVAIARRIDELDPPGSTASYENVRTYNFPLNRIADHRLGSLRFQLDTVMGGQLDPIIDALSAAEL